MKTNIFFLTVITVFLFPTLVLSQNTNKTYIAIEVNNVLCGYSEIYYSDTIIEDKNYIVLNQKTFANFHALGRDISSQQKFDYHIDPENGNFVFHKSFTQQGDMIMGNKIYTQGNKLRIINKGKEEIIEVTDETILPNTQLFTHLKTDFNNNQLDSKKYKVFDPRTNKVKVVEYTKKGEEILELACVKFEALVLTELDTETGITNKIWINKTDGSRLKTESPNRITMYVTDSSVPGRIKTGSWDHLFFVKTDTKIHDFKKISFMKAKVKLEAIPESTREDLGVTGQEFKGSVNNKFIDGEFIVSHEKYDGKNAPKFPFNKEKYEIPNLFLKSEYNIESDDNELIALAQKLTIGCNNLWEASCKISNWVAENIDGGILDGSAKDTYSSRKGLCGAQSKLMAALCRAAGIPARVVWGCMYTPEMNGSFGHHAWNEVFMGKDGWIPVDVTIHETDYVDSGHIRLGILKTPQTTINYEEIKILDYQIN